uniref:Uncharacterized protein n=1 Tax=Acrobeloides nanus TaxID=290746 RepID=A0A914CNT4_9BILA
MKRFIIIIDDESTYEVDKIINLMAGNQCAILSRCGLVLNNASDEFIASFAQNALQVFRDAVDIEPFVKEIEFSSGTIYNKSSFKTDSIIDELIDQKVDYEREEITEPSDCEYAYLHTFNVRREDGWNLQMKLIKVKNRPPMSCFGDGTYSSGTIDKSYFKTDSIIDELRDQEVDYDYQHSTAPPGCGQWSPIYADQHTFKVRREDGWNLQMKLIKTYVINPQSSQGGITYSNWNLENCIFERLKKF